MWGTAAIACGCICAAAGVCVVVATSGGSGSSGTSPPTQTYSAPPTAYVPRTVPNTYTRATVAPHLPSTTVSAADAMLAQIPPITNTTALDASDVTKWVGWLQRIIPGNNEYLTAARYALNCALSQGVLGLRGYLGKNDSSATIVAVVSYRQLLNWQTVLYDCTLGRLVKFFGGGPGAPHPCATAYYYDTTRPVQSRYFVFVASTDGGLCSGVENWHKGLATGNAVSEWIR